MSHVYKINVNDKMTHELEERRVIFFLRFTAKGFFKLTFAFGVAFGSSVQTRRTLITENRWEETTSNFNIGISYQIQLFPANSTKNICFVRAISRKIRLCTFFQTDSRLIFVYPAGLEN